ncbi:MAG: hypothetical protein ABIG94_04930 [Pseudomonadota bacterium]
MTRTNRIILSLAMAAVLLVAVTPGGAAQPLYPMGSVSIELTSVAAGIGASWGSGTLRFEGKVYPFKVSGLTVGDVGISTINAVGNVYNLKSASDLAGNYVAAGAGLTLAGGVGGVTMRNQKGVLINLYTVQQGLQLTIGPQGFNIDLR